MRMVLIAIASFLISISGTRGVAHAAPVVRFDPGTQTKRELTVPLVMHGYKEFKNVCKKCHTRDSGKGSFLYAEKKSMRAWNRVFYARYPKCARDGSWDTVAPETLLAINDYLYQNGYDAYDPYDAANCG